MDDVERTELKGSLQRKDCEIAALTEKLELHTELTRMIVHDLKGPLGSVLANLDLLMSCRLGDEEKAILETAVHAGSDLLNITNTLLEIGKMERGKLELNLSVINLQELLQAAAAKLKSLSAQKDIALEIRCRSDVASVAVDAALIERIIFNLVMNAIRYTRDGGTITLMTENGRSADTVLLAVSDTGIGIPEEFQETIFDLYAQVRPPGERVRRQGSGAGNPERRQMVNAGIGLAFCKLAVEQHGGTIWVESEWGRGSTFFVSLPTTLVPSGSDLL